MQLTAPSAPGSYYYGACVDTVADESDTTKQLLVVRAGDRREPESDPEPEPEPEPEPSNPDLEVGSPAVDDNSPETGGPFTLSATVTNAR